MMRRFLRVVIACSIFIIIGYRQLASSTSSNNKNLVVGYNTTLLVDGQQQQQQTMNNNSSYYNHIPINNSTIGIINKIYNSTCHGKIEWKNEMKYLCAGHFVQTASTLLLAGDHVNIVQIGAHVGFEHNDPLAHGLSVFLEMLTNVTKTEALKKRFHWTFVEPSPASYRGLELNLAKPEHSSICDMRSVNAAVISDLDDDQGGYMTFYGISDAIDPVSGYDSISKKVLPNWLTQISSLSKEQVYKPMFTKAFAQFGLDMNDYVVEFNVTAMAYTNLMKKVLVPNSQGVQKPLLVLVDTEGFDCNVVEGISEQSPYLPTYLVYEHVHCNEEMAEAHLHEMGYFTSKVSENVLAIHLASSEYWPIEV